MTSIKSEEKEKKKLGVQAKCFDIVFDIPERAPFPVLNINQYRSYVMASLELLSENSGHLLGCMFATSIHDKDVDANGIEVRPHVHAYVECDSRHTLSAVLNSLVKLMDVNATSISVAKSHDRIRSIRYLIHKDSPSKFQYDIGVVECCKKFAPTCYEILSLDDHSFLSVNELLFICQNANWDEMNIMQELGLHVYQKYRWAIKDVLSAHFERVRLRRELEQDERKKGLRNG